MAWKENDKEKKQVYMKQYCIDHKDEFYKKRKEYLGEYRIKNRTKMLEVEYAREKRYLNLCRGVQGNKCSRCGVKEKLHFHHVILSTKKVDVSLATNFEAMLFESYKCTLLCNGCHGKLHKLMEKVGQYENTC